MLRVWYQSAVDVAMEGTEHARDRAERHPVMGALATARPRPHAWEHRGQMKLDLRSKILGTEAILPAFRAGVGLSAHA
jgi:hypothetical protein